MFSWSKRYVVNIVQIFWSFYKVWKDVSLIDWQADEMNMVAWQIERSFKVTKADCDVHTELEWAWVASILSTSFL